MFSIGSRAWVAALLLLLLPALSCHAFPVDTPPPSGNVQSRPHHLYMDDARMDRLGLNQIHESHESDETDKPTDFSSLDNLSGMHELQRIVGTRNGALFVDEVGRSRIFHGTNVVFKAWPYVPDIRPDALPKFSFNDIDVAILRNHSTTAIRLGVMWAGVEPERGVFNQTYLDIMKSIVSMCSDAGIYVLLDFHQDIFSERFCGEGVPLWAANPRSGRFAFPFPLDKAYPVDERGIPSQEDCHRHDWATYQATPPVSEAYQRLYDNYDGYRDAFVEYWKLVAKEMLPFKNVLGYDLINEPWNGNIGKDPSLSSPIVANRKNLQPFYDVIAEGIRTVDPNAIIFFESVTTIQKTVGFQRVPGGSDFASKSVLSYHYYSTVQKQYNLRDTIGFRVNQAAELQCGSMLTEFEMGNGDGADHGSNVPAVINTARDADSYFMSYTGWEYTNYVPMTGTNNGIRNPETGAVRPGMAAAFSRTYAHAIAGTPTFMEFIDETGEFTLRFTYSGGRGLAGVTEIRTNFGIHYPQGYVVRIEGGRFKSIAEREGKDSRGSIFIVPDTTSDEEGGAVEGDEVTVVVART
ncbi:hypothetical protein HDU80_010704 [Chytriomyces hyalinus]|nr:hypothetical protein HDU80_010704 [Chytriomyces hyalinus]